MIIKDGLKKLDLGNSVAEYDNQLEKHFLETQTYTDVVNDKCDIISGDKGTGKTAIFKILKNKYHNHPELLNVEILPAFNIQGSPIFQKLTQHNVLSEGKYSSIWKTFIISLVGNWVLGIYKESFSDEMFELDKILQATGLRTESDSPDSIFSLIIQPMKKLLSPKSAECTITFSETGIPIITPRIELDQDNPAIKLAKEVSGYLEIEHDTALTLLNIILEEIETSVWIALDRLDEAFTGFPLHELPSLRSLLRAYLDLSPYSNIKLKIFIRNDLFRKITKGGFVNLTHINARKKIIIWDDEDLLSLLCKRIRENQDFLEYFRIESMTPDNDLFYAIFPQKVDIGERKPETLSWILSRIRDGNNIKAPRNLIDLTQKILEAQSRREERSTREYTTSEPIFESDSIKKGLASLSEQRVTDTLLAESIELQSYIEMFRHQKAEHSRDSLSDLFNIHGDELTTIIQGFTEIGFLERLTGGTYKIPMLYRDGLSIIQGKGFTS